MTNQKSRSQRAFVVTILFLAGFALWGWQNQTAIAAPLGLASAQEAQEYETYTVQPGDTLAAIALQYGVPLEVLMQINGISDANFIFVGQQLQIPINLAPTETPTAEATATATETATATTVPTETATALPSAPVTPTRTPTANPRATKPPTATATPTLTPTHTPAPAANGDALWSAPDQPIELFSPVNGAIYHSPIEVIGYSQTFEASVVVRLRDAAGNILGTRRSVGGGADGFAFFHTYVRFEVSEATAATLEIFEVSAKDGSEINQVQVPIILRPGQRVIDVEQPTVGETICAPVALQGYSNTFEANLNAEVLQRDGIIVLASGNATGGSLGNFAEFETALNLEIDKAQPGLVAIYETDAQDGGAVDQIRIPVSLLPAQDPQCQ